MRCAGVLLPITSLPSKYGIGTIGKEAYNFVDFLEKCGQTYWQILPIGPTGYADSPYQSLSTYAGNPYLIDLEMLVSDGVLNNSEIAESGFFENPDFVDYGDLYEKRFELLRKAAQRVDALDEQFALFCKANSDWLDDYALFMSLKLKYGMGSFHTWTGEHRLYNKELASKAAAEFKDKIHFWSVLQYFFYKQWDRFRAYANSKGIKIIGDVPIYVSPDSADIWVNHELFQINAERAMTNVSGCPPDTFSETGQLWGNPLYDWKAHKKQKYEWWIKRMRHAERCFDAVRIDHFRGFAEYYSVPASNKTAAKGKWKRGPGKKLIAKIKSDVPNLTIIAEDLGFLTASVHRLLKFSGFPGMNVLQFAFSDFGRSIYLPHKHVKNSVTFTGTHDNCTTKEWVQTASCYEIDFAKRYLKVKEGVNLTSELVKTAMYSNSDTCIIPIQDWLELGAEARINIPGTVEENWKFRIRKEMLSENLMHKILYMTQISGRINSSKR